MRLGALRQGNSETAAHLLETIVRDNGYPSDTLSNAYTIALHSAGKTGELAGIEEVSANTEDDFVELGSA